MVAGTGNGTLHADLLPALHEAQSLGIRVWRVTRCASGRVAGDAGSDANGSRSGLPAGATGAAGAAAELI